MLFGGADNDTLTGGDADDQGFGQSGNDRMVWNPGDDTDLNEALLISASRFASYPALSRFQAANRDGRTLAAMTSEEAEQVLAGLVGAIEDEILRMN